jgi:hypothetical protein
MSIRQKRTMTEKSLEAHRRNARQSRGPLTEVGKKRSRDANISHGFYSQDGGAALVALGEDPREYQKLAGAVAKKWQPADAYEEQLGTQLIRAVWRARRSDRMQEGLALRLAQEAERWRQDNLHARMTKLSLNAGGLRSLAKAAGQPEYVTAPNDLEMVKSFQVDGVLQDMGAVIMDLLIALRPEADPRPFSLPGTGTGEVAQSAPTAEPTLPAASEAPNPTPEEDGEDQDDGCQGLRQSLQNILLREADLLEEQRTACLQEILNGPSPFERAAELASAYGQMKLLQRVEDSNFRQVWRITDLFLKLKGGAPERKKMKMPPQDSDAAPAPAMEAPEIAPQPSLMNSQHSSSHAPAASDPAPEPPPPPASTQPTETSENEGASGKVQSNQCGNCRCDVLAHPKRGDAAPQRTTERTERPRSQIRGGPIQLTAV